MSGNEIREQINKNNELIKAKLTSFVLTDEIKEIMALNAKLRRQCPHQFKEGFCIFCDEFEEDSI